jgi:hypothetical protein
VVKIDTATRAVALEVPHAGGIDGLRAHPGGFIVSDWKGKTELIAKGKGPRGAVDTTAEKVKTRPTWSTFRRDAFSSSPTFFDNRVDGLYDRGLTGGGGRSGTIRGRLFGVWPEAVVSK